MGPPLPDPVAAGFGQSPVNIVSRKVKIVGMYTRFRFVMTCSHACFITEWQLCCHKRKQRSVMIRVSRPFLVPAKKQELESCVRQTQAGPHIFLLWGNSRTTGLFVTIPFTIMLCSRPMFPPNQSDGLIGSLP